MPGPARWDVDRMRLLVIIGVVLFLALQYRLWFGTAGYFEVKALTQEVEKRQAVNEQLRQRNADLALEVAAYKNGLDAVEARARSELGMIQEGETFFLVVD